MLQSLPRLFFAVLLVAAWPAMAQEDPPARVGRLAHLENEVDFRVDRSDQGGPATLNWPISSGAMLETGRPGRAEVWIGSTAYRLGDDSQVEFAVVDDARVDVRLDDGSLALSILDRDQVDDVVVATPDGQVRFLTPGRYRIDVNGERSELTVQAGRATFADGQRVTPVAAGQKVSRWNDGSERLDGHWEQDAFDHWVANRENATLATTARRYVSPHMTGYQDLDAYGDWQTAPDYGAVWYPRGVADDWAPYRYGRWAWVAPWGWTWIDLAPWGFAPFHYGRWVIIYGRWAWVPGRLEPRPVYAPALVAWIGNPGWSVSFSFGAAPAVGWFPLAPREVYVPGHRHSHRYVRQINVSHIRDVTVIDRALRPGRQAPLVHHRSPRAVTVVPANLVREGRPISGRDLHRHERSELGRAPLARQAPAAAWLPPAPGAVRSHDGKRHSVGGRQPRRDSDDSRQDARERRAPAGKAMPRERPASRPAVPEGVNERDGEGRRDAPRRPELENRGRPAEPRVDVSGRPVEAGASQPEATPLPQHRETRQRPVAEPPEREPRLQKTPPARQAEAGPNRSVDVFGRPVEADARQPEAKPAPARREARQRPAVQPVERESRPGPVRDFQRIERQPPREVAPQVRQSELRRAAPEARAPAPKPPRQPVQPGRGRSDQDRRHDDEQGKR